VAPIYSTNPGNHTGAFSAINPKTDNVPVLQIANIIQILN